MIKLLNDLTYPKSQWSKKTNLVFYLSCIVNIKHKKWNSFLCIFLIIQLVVAQTKQSPSLSIAKTNVEIKIDGVLDEVVWQQADKASDFIQVFPSDTSLAKTKTEVMLTYDDKNLYVAAICYDSIPGNYVIQSLKRDFSYPVSDAFAIFIDPFDDKTNGFCFTVNPLGVQREGLISNGGGFGVTTAWDAKWFSEVTRSQGKWVVEMAIPFKSIRYKSDITKWGINFGRNDLKRNESSVWASVPRVFNVASLAYTGSLNWDAPPKKAGSNIQVIPYAIGSANQDFLKDSVIHFGANAGLDAKVAISSSLNLDLTFNPDFAQVEVDRQVTNLTRFNLFFPERRNFFIENSDLFEQFGFRQIRPFFSRNIGLYNGNVVPIIGGARLSGRIDENWRIGIMSMQTDRRGDLGLKSQNYTVAAVQRTVFKRSNIALIVVNRQAYEKGGFYLNNYNRVVGGDFNFASANNKWIGKVFYHQSFSPGKFNNAFANASFLRFNNNNIMVEWNHEYVNKNYDAETGFVPRINLYDPLTKSIKQFSYWRIEPWVAYTFYPKSKKVNSHGLGVYLNHYLDSSFQTNESSLKGYYFINFRNTSTFELAAYHNLIFLPFKTDITFSGKKAINSGTYQYNEISILYKSSAIKLLNFNANIHYGTYFIGHKFSAAGEVFYRKQPWGIFSMNFSYDNISLPSPYKGTELYLFGPKIELSFTKSIFLTTYVQYNTQANNVNINSRLQWRFRPLSDLYVVYTDNYNSINFGQKNKALVIKFIYWI